LRSFCAENFFVSVGTGTTGITGDNFSACFLRLQDIKTLFENFLLNLKKTGSTILTQSRGKDKTEPSLSKNFFSYFPVNKPSLSVFSEIIL